MKITNDDIKRFNKTNLNDICFNDVYNLSKGYCKMDIWLKLNSIRVSHFGMFSKGMKLTIDIIKQYPQEITIQ